MLFGAVFIEKNAKNKKKTRCFSKSFALYLHNGSTLEHDSNRFWKLQCRATTFVFLTILGNWSCDHHPSNPLHGPLHISSFLSWFLPVFDHIQSYFPFWYTVDPERITWHPIHHSYFWSHFLAIFRTMKYSGAKNEIAMISVR